MPTDPENAGRTRPRLSLVLITLDEARNLPRCLASAGDLADEILLVDCGSSDGTPDIARAEGARVLYRDFTGFGAQKQFALEQARGDWLLFLDADECLDETARDEIRSIVAASSSPVAGYALRRATYYLGRWVKYGPWWGEVKLRLVRRGRANWEPTNVHESLRMTEGAPVRLRGCLLHYPYASLGHQLAKIDHYTDLIARRDASTPGWRCLFGIGLEPWLVFIHRYILLGGFLDGRHGLLGCGMTAFYFFLRYAKILQRQSGQE